MPCRTTPNINQCTFTRSEVLKGRRRHIEQPKDVHFILLSGQKRPKISTVGQRQDMLERQHGTDPPSSTNPGNP